MDQENNVVITSDIALEKDVELMLFVDHADGLVLLSQKEHKEFVNLENINHLV